ncbi:MAG: hypothetical protein WA192_18255 [Candidatus Acidiferrales bacterium]
MQRFEYAVTTAASPSVAWEVYTNWKMWHSFASIYGDIKWLQGEPWSIGSKMEIEILHPVKMVVHHLIVNCKPGRELGWVDRALGVTMHQWVDFDESSSGGTRVRTWGEIKPAGMTLAGRKVEELVKVFTETWYENFRSLCDEFAEVGI